MTWPHYLTLAMFIHARAVVEEHLSDADALRLVRRRVERRAARAELRVRLGGQVVWRSRQADAFDEKTGAVTRWKPRTAERVHDAEGPRYREHACTLGVPPRRPL